MSTVLNTCRAYQLTPAFLDAVPQDGVDNVCIICVGRVSTQTLAMSNDHRVEGDTKVFAVVTLELVVVGVLEPCALIVDGKTEYDDETCDAADAFAPPLRNTWMRGRTPGGGDLRGY